MKKRQNNNSKDELEHIIEQLPEHIYWQDINGVILGCNEQQMLDLGFTSKSEIIGKMVHEMPSHEQADDVINVNKLVIESKKTMVIEEKIVLPNGEIQYFRSTKKPRFDKKGNVIGVLGISIDITAQKKAEAREISAIKKTIEQEKETEALREKVVTMQMLGGTIAHEIRNPLLAIGSARDALAKYLPILLKAYDKVIMSDTAFELIRQDILQEIPDMLQIIKSEIDASNLFIDTLLSKIKEKPDTNNFEECSISECIEIAMQRYPFISQKSRNKVHWLKNDDFIFIGNKTMVIHVIFNLLKNAMHYIGEAAKGEVTLWVEIDEQTNYFHFKDTGDVSTLFRTHNQAAL